MGFEHIDEVKKETEGMSHAISPDITVQPSGEAHNQYIRDTMIKEGAVIASSFIFLALLIWFVFRKLKRKPV